VGKSLINLKDSKTICMPVKLERRGDKGTGRQSEKDLENRHETTVRGSFSFVFF
jgi:hypothetical protein